MRNRVLVCYDISSDRRRDKVARACESYGVRIQFSIFECPLDALRLSRLRSGIEEMIHHEQDQVLFVTLGPESGDASLRIEAIGRPYTLRSRVVVV